MPLLYKKPFLPNKCPSGLKDSDEVFHCELTNEIFTDYEEFCERIYLCNSLVWSCNITGRTNLTYQEALTSEENALKVLADFPISLRIPIFFLITVSDKKSIAELADYVFMFARDRYFVGETVEVNFANETWCTCSVIQVTYPPDKVLQEYQANNLNNNNSHGTNGSRDFWPPSILYSYEVEIINNASKDGLTYFVRGDQVRRKKGLYTRDKNKLFIKQYVHQIDGIWKLKDDIYEKYMMDTVKLTDIFAGDLANLILRKPNNKEQSNEKSKPKKEKKQESIQKYFKQKSSPSKSSGSGNSEHKKVTPQKKSSSVTPQKSLIQKLKNKYKGVGQNNKKANLMNKINNKAEELQEKKKQKKKLGEAIRSLSKDELLKLALEWKDRNLSGVKVFGENMKLSKENRQQLGELIKELNKRREDLECEDLKDLPVPSAVQLRIPNEYFGDFVMILEFLYSFGTIVNKKDYFPTGFPMELLERALVENEVAGPLNDLIQLLLSAIFDLQEQHFDDPCESSAARLDEGIKNLKSEYVSVMTLSNAAAFYSQKFQGMPLSQLTMDCATLTEILRLHLLSSGRQRCADDVGSSLSLDDPGRALCINNPELIQLLTHKSIFELPIENRIEILTCLINQVLMFTSVRETIDERGEKNKAGRIDLRNQQVAEQKKQKELLIKAKEQKEKAAAAAEKAATTPNSTASPAPVPVAPLSAEEKESIKDSRVRKEAELARKARDLSEQEMEFQVVPLGVDRAYRRFWLFSSMPGLFVEDDEEYPGACLPKGTPFANGAEECLKYVRKLFEDGGLSNKENLVGINKDQLNISTTNNGSAGGTPNKKMLAEKNGSSACDVASSSSGKTTPGRNNSKIVETKNACKPLTCWGDPVNCPVHMQHSLRNERTKWSFYKSESELDDLIECLNTRGHRESKLKKVLIQEKQRIINSLAKCPFSKLEPADTINESQNGVRKSTRLGPKYDNPNLDFPKGTPVNDVLAYNLRDIILGWEQEIFGGLLGCLKVNDRDAWRTALLNNSYDKQCDVLRWGTNCSESSDAMEVDGPEYTNSLGSKIKQEDGVEASNSSRCPTPLPFTGLEVLTNWDVKRQEIVHNMACAILQLEQSVDPRYLGKPLADDEDTNNQELESSSTSSSPNSTSNEDRKKRNKISIRERWEESLMYSNSLSQLFIHMYTLESSINWSRSALKIYSCRACKQRDPEKMLLCDSCNKGYHMYCLKPKLTRVPEGDWFCPNCQQKNDKENAKKKNKRYRPSATTPVSEKPDDDDKKEPSGVIGRCKICRTKGELAVCDECNNGFHLECISPPLRHFPRFTWTCSSCRHQAPSTTKNNAKDYSDENSSPSDSDDGNSSTTDVERCPSRRRCAKTATAKISQFAKQLRTNSWDGDQDEDGNNKENAESFSTRRRSRRSMEATSSDVNMATASSRDLPLDNAALQEILEIIMHHKDAWPFLTPVTKSEAPDYHSIIKTPMDFGTIKHKLNMLEYSKNSQVIADAMLVFSNCYMYNQADTEVFNAGERLQKVFEKLCSERKMKIKNSASAAAIRASEEEEDENDGDENNKKSEHEKEGGKGNEDGKPLSSRMRRTVF